METCILAVLEEGHVLNGILKVYYQAFYSIQQDDLDKIVYSWLCFINKIFV